jgi:hypothetical protein
MHLATAHQVQGSDQCAEIYGRHDEDELPSGLVLDGFVRAIASWLYLVRLGERFLLSMVIRSPLNIADLGSIFFWDQDCHVDDCVNEQALG